MKVTQMVKELEEAAGRLGRKVRYETGSFRGGYCTVTGDDLIVLNKRHTPEIHFSVLANALRDMPIDDLYLRPAVRSAIEEAWAASSSQIDGDLEDAA